MHILNLSAVVCVGLRLIPMHSPGAAKLLAKPGSAVNSKAVYNEPRTHAERRGHDLGHPAGKDKINSNNPKTVFDSQFLLDASAFGVRCSGLSGSAPVISAVPDLLISSMLSSNSETCLRPSASVCG
jgi:hypothetical protein